MKKFIILFIFPVIVLASGEGGDHTHGAAGETEHLYPVLAVFGLLIIGGAIFHFVSKKK